MGLELELDAEGVERVKLREEGWKTWNWRGHACNYISAGENNTGPIVTLVHGFGAHSYHWRYTIPALARAGYRVYALCMLGYGWSPKVEEEYCMELWGQQVIDFSQQIGGATEKDKTIIVGNSIGALAALYAASTFPQSCKGLCLVNSAGNFEPDAAAGPEKKTLAQRAVGDAKDIDDKSADKSFAAQIQEAFGRLSPPASSTRPSLESVKFSARCTSLKSTTISCVPSISQRKIRVPSKPFTSSLSPALAPKSKPATSSETGPARSCFSGAKRTRG